MVGEDAKFAVHVSGLPAPDIEWTKDNDPLANTEKYLINRSNENCALIVRKCDISDSGIYNCKAINREGASECVFQLTVSNNM